MKHPIRAARTAARVINQGMVQGPVEQSTGPCASR